jgi:hypothetical protein
VRQPACSAVDSAVEPPAIDEADAEDAERARLILDSHTPRDSGVLCKGCLDGKSRLVAIDYCTDRIWALGVLGLPDAGPGVG